MINSAVRSKNKLAIVIPAYKIAFFRQSIESIANQTCKDFTLYIGDDASPYDFKDVIDFYKDKITIIYKRFEENMGGNDLVAHWNRCIDMSLDEEWIWLFSDDDLMDDNCVELFYKHIEVHKDNCLLHFNIQVVDMNNEKIFKTKRFPSHYSTSQYFSQVIKGNVYSCVVEYVFKRRLFEMVNRFEHFDLAWSSDTATWMKLSLYGGVKTIDGALIKWRISNINISSLSNDKTIVLRKISASVKYVKWSRRFLEENKLNDDTSEIEKVLWLLVGIVYTTTLSFREKYYLIVDSLRKLSLNNLRLIVLFFWMYEELKRKVKSAICYN